MPIMKPTICCDYDSTILLHSYEMVNGLYGKFCASYSWRDNIPVINELLEYQNKGYDLYIVTFRGPNTIHVSNQNDQPPEKHLPYLKETYGLSFKDVIYTDMECKVPFITNLNAEKHYDDDQNVIIRLYTLGAARPVWIKHNDSMVNPYLQELIDDNKIDVMQVSYE